MSFFETFLNLIMYEVSEEVHMIATTTTFLENRNMFMHF